MSRRPSRSTKQALSAIKAQTDAATLATITTLAADGHSLEGIAINLNRLQLRAPRGGKWARMQVSRLAAKHGIKVAYSQAKIEAAKARDAVPTPKPAVTLCKIDTLTDPPREAADVREGRAAAIDQYASKMGIHRWLVATAVEVFESRLDELAWRIERGPAAVPESKDRDATKLAEKHAEDAWLDLCDDDKEMRAAVDGATSIAAVEAIFCWYADQLSWSALRTKLWQQFDEWDQQPSRDELRAA